MSKRWYHVSVENTVTTNHWVEAATPGEAEAEAARLGRADVPFCDTQRADVMEVVEKEEEEETQDPIAK